MSGELRAGVLLLSLLAAACSVAPGAEHAPVPTAVSPGRGWSGAATKVTVEGRFRPVPVRRLGSGEVYLDAGCSATLGGTALGQVELLSDGRLSAVVPAGLAPGLHRLRVVNALGLDGTLDDAFLVSAEGFARLEATAQAPSEVLEGQALEVALSVTNRGDAAARAVRPRLEVVQGDASVGREPEPAELAAGATTTFAWTLSASAGTLRLRLSAEATDGESGAPLASQETQVEIAVLRRAALSGSAELAAARASVGQALELRYAVENTGDAPLASLEPRLELSGSGQLEVLAAPAAPVALEGGGRHEFVWSLVARAAGQATLVLSASGTEAPGGSAVEAAPTTLPLTVVSAAALTASASAAPRVSAGQTFDLQVECANGGEAAALAVAGTLTSSGPPLEILAAPAPAAIPGAGTHRFLWSLRATATGELTLSARLSGLDENSHEPVDASCEAQVAVETGPQLALSVGAAPALTGVGRSVTVTAWLTNSGEVAATGLVPTLTTSGTAAFAVAEGPKPASLDLPGGAAASFAWTLTATSAGAARASVSIAGQDANGGGGLSVGPEESGPIRVLTPASLQGALSLPAGPVNAGALVELAFEVSNPGEEAAGAVAPLPPTLLSGSAELVAGPSPASVALAGGESHVFRWQYRADAPGALAFATRAEGASAVDGSPLVSAEARTAVLTVLAPAALEASVSAPASVGLGRSIDVELTVHNPGGSTALALLPSLSLAGDGAAAVSAGPVPESADLAGGQSTVFRWTLAASASGMLELTAGASATDATDGAAVSSPPAAAGVRVDRPAKLHATLRVPAQLGIGQTFRATLTVTNGGDSPSTEVTPSTLSLGGAGTATLLSGPAPHSATIAGGESVGFTWELRAETYGALEFLAAASGFDGNSGEPIATPLATASAFVSEVALLASDPFGDGTGFTYLFAHAGRIYLGPNKAGAGAVRFDPDGSNPESIAFVFPKDVSGHASENNAAGAPPFPSIGAPGCTANTLACGPDNEDGRGLFTSGRIGGADWLVIGGAKSSGRLDHVYLTPDTGGTLAMRYLDLNSIVGGNAKGFSAAAVFNDRLYLGFPDDGGARPYLLVLPAPPAAPGLDAVNNVDLLDLNADKMPGLRIGNPATTIGIDAISVFAGRVYVANNGGVIRSTVPQPGSYKDAPGDWAPATPAAPAYTGKSSLVTLQFSEIDPAEKAVPAMVGYAGRLYLGRNTVDGPQLFACSPSLGGSTSDCDPDDLALVAPNTVGDPLLTQFDDPDDTRLTLLAATDSHLYVGFDNAVDGVIIYRTSVPAPASAADFEGMLHCPADLGTSACPGLGGNGLGSGMKRIYDSAALDAGGAPRLYLVAGEPSGAAQVFSVGD